MKPNFRTLLNILLKNLLWKFFPKSEKNPDQPQSLRSILETASFSYRLSYKSTLYFIVSFWMPDWLLFSSVKFFVDTSERKTCSNILHKNFRHHHQNHSNKSLKLSVQYFLFNSTIFYINHDKKVKFSVQRLKKKSHYVVLFTDSAFNLKAAHSNYSAVCFHNRFNCSRSFARSEISELIFWKRKKKPTHVETEWQWGAEGKNILITTRWSVNERV